MHPVCIFSLIVPSGYVFDSTVIQPSPRAVKIRRPAVLFESTFTYEYLLRAGEGSRRSLTENDRDIMNVEFRQSANLFSFIPVSAKLSSASNLFTQKVVNHSRPQNSSVMPERPKTHNS
jgi:hypothetical protein